MSRTDPGSVRLILCAAFVTTFLPAQATVQWQKLETDDSFTSPFTPPSFAYHLGENRLYALSRDFGAFLHFWTGTGWQSVDRPPFDGALTSIFGYDPAGERMLLFGGFTTGTLQDHTWAWNGVEWTELSPATSASPRWRGTMTADLARNRVVLFGGWADTDALILSEDTWEWDGSTWIQRFPATVPPGRLDPAIAYDSRRERVILYGGNANGPRLSDTWEWDGEDWRSVTTPMTPPPALRPRLAFDSARGRTVQYIGGSSGDETWEYDGESWLRREVRPSSGVRGSNIGYDAAGRQVLTVDLIPGPNFAPVETWSYTPVYPADFQPFGEGCPGAAGSPTLEASSLPWTGDGLVLEMSSLTAFPDAIVLGMLGASKDEFMGQPLPLGLGFLGREDCTLYIEPANCAFLPNEEDRATWRLQVPPNPDLLGVELFTQAVVLDFHGYRTTNAGVVVIGSR